MRFFQALLPREEKFFHLFDAHAGTIILGAQALRDLLQGGDGVQEACARIVAHENTADDIARAVLLGLRRSFITPFDRGDIKDLISLLDDSIDQMQKTAKAIMMFEVASFEPHMQQMADIILRCAELTVEAVGMLGEMRDKSVRINAITEEITRLEDQADELNDAGIKALFLKHRGGDAMAFIVGNEIYDHLEKVVDRFEDVANRISGIVIEQVTVTIALILLIVVALAFDFLNGLHDAANSIATIVSTRVLSPQYAVAWAAFFNFIAFMVFGLNVAKTIGSGIIDPAIIGDQVIFAALMGAIVWNVVTWLGGIPSSSSHALIGGLVGGGIAAGGFHAVNWSGLDKTIAAIVISPATGFVLALVLVLLVSWLFVRSTPFKTDKLFRHIQFLSAGAYSLGHGGNDAQKTMGIIAALLFAHGMSGATFHVPLWVVLTCQTAMALGTLFGGWRIVRTMGSRITHLTPVQGVCAETAGAITLFMATYMGIPVSTTHTITGAIVGVGAARRVSAVRWNIARSIVVAWVVTMPAAAVIAALSFYLAGAIGL